MAYLPKSTIANHSEQITNKPRRTVTWQRCDQKQSLSEEIGSFLTTWLTRLYKRKGPSKLLLLNHQEAMVIVFGSGLDREDKRKGKLYERERERGMIGEKIKGTMKRKHKYTGETRGKPERKI